MGVGNSRTSVKVNGAPEPPDPVELIEEDTNAPVNAATGLICWMARQGIPSNGQELVAILEFFEAVLQARRKCSKVVREACSGPASAEERDGKAAQMLSCLRKEEEQEVLIQNVLLLQLRAVLRSFPEGPIPSRAGREACSMFCAEVRGSCEELMRSVGELRDASQPLKAESSSEDGHITHQTFLRLAIRSMAYRSSFMWETLAILVQIMNAGGTAPRRHARKNQLFWAEVNKSMKRVANELHSYLGSLEIDSAPEEERRKAWREGTSLLRWTVFHIASALDGEFQPQKPCGHLPQAPYVDRLLLLLSSCDDKFCLMFVAMDSSEFEKGHSSIHGACHSKDY